MFTHVPGPGFGKERHRADLFDHFGPFAFRRRVGLKPREPLVPQVKEEIRCPVTLQLGSSRTVRKSGRAQRAVVKKYVGEAGNRIRSEERRVGKGGFSTCSFRGERGTKK